MQEFRHNNKILNPKMEATKKCNCRSYESRLKTRNDALIPKKPPNHPPPDWFPRECPVGGECLTESVIYSATVDSSINNSNKSSMTYIGLTGDSFKSLFNGHTSTFRHRKGNMSTLSTHIWDLEDKKANYEIKWQIKKRAMVYKPGASFCDLCVSEKVHSLLANPKTSLNKRSEILEACRHRHLYKLGNLKT